MLCILYVLLCILCYVMLCYVIMLCYVVLCCVVLCCVVLCCVVLCCVALCFVVLCCVVLCCVVLCCVVLCCVVLRCVMLCYKLCINVKICKLLNWQSKIKLKLKLIKCHYCMHAYIQQFTLHNVGYTSNTTIKLYRNIVYKLR